MAEFSDGARTLEYARPRVWRRPKPTRHSRLSIVAWALFTCGVAYEAVVVWMVYRSTTIHHWSRFRRNVGDPELFIGLARWTYFLAVIVAVAALAKPDRKHWAAWMAWGASMVCWIEYNGRWTPHEHVVGMLLLAAVAAWVSRLLTKRVAVDE